MDKKQCIKCSVEKTLDQFNMRGVWYMGTCKSCLSEQAKRNREKRARAATSAKPQRHPWQAV